MEKLIVSRLYAIESFVEWWGESQLDKEKSDRNEVGEQHDSTATRMGSPDFNK